jgi:acetoin utilization deacetylase AcuC-like enzyme
VQYPSLGSNNLLTLPLSQGFCLYNFAAAAAIHAVKRGKRVSILDWDVHYGQGVANIVHGYENIRYVSIHQTPAFPYEGEQAETVGNCMTLPMPPETTWTCGYKDFFQKAIQFCSSGQEWQPDLVIVCAGYDGLSNDSLASCNLNAKDYGRMAKRLCQHLIEQASGNNEKRPAVMLGLEGGYCIRDGGQSGNLPDAVVETIQALVELDF